jgi:hypothetical protein
MAERDSFAGPKLGAGDVEHRRIEIGRDQTSIRGQGVAQPAGDDAGAGRGLQHPQRIAGGGALRDVGGVIGEDDRTEALIIVLRDTADEAGCVVAHDEPPIAPAAA